MPSLVYRKPYTTNSNTECIETNTIAQKPTSLVLVSDPENSIKCFSKRVHRMIVVKNSMSSVAKNNIAWPK